MGSNIKKSIHTESPPIIDNIKLKMIKKYINKKFFLIEMAYQILMLDNPDQWMDEIPKMGAHGFKIDIAGSVDEARKMLGQKQYDCAVIEPFDPDFIYQEKRSPTLQLMKGLQMPLVIASTYRQTDFELSFGFNGFKAYISKPCLEENALERAVTAAMQTPV